MEWTPPTLLLRRGGKEVDPRGSTASKGPSGEASASQAKPESEMKASKTIVGVDTAKHVFQLYWADTETGE